MFDPHYLIILDAEAFPSNEFLCLGTQLQSITEATQKLTKPLSWLAADVHAVSPVPKILGINSFKLKKVGNTNSLISACQNIHQFLSGVFLGTENPLQENRHLISCCMDTEDPQFRPCSIPGAVIEIRTFDTSYFEIYSENKILIESLSHTYGAKIVTKPS